MKRCGGDFIGFTGLHAQPSQFTFSPYIEIAWRLEQKCWGNGFAIEAATACLKFAFDSFKLNQVAAFTAVQTTKSQAVMQRLSMQLKNDFNHPALDNSILLQRHVFYQVNSTQFRQTKTSN